MHRFLWFQDAFGCLSHYYSIHRSNRQVNELNNSKGKWDSSSFTIVLHSVVMIFELSKDEFKTRDYWAIVSIRFCWPKHNSAHREQTWLFQMSPTWAGWREESIAVREWPWEFADRMLGWALASLFHNWMRWMNCSVIGNLLRFQNATDFTEYWRAM